MQKAKTNMWLNASVFIICVLVSHGSGAQRGYYYDYGSTRAQRAPNAYSDANDYRRYYSRSPIAATDLYQSGRYPSNGNAAVAVKDQYQSGRYRSKANAAVAVTDPYQSRRYSNNGNAAVAKTDQYQTGRYLSNGNAAIAATNQYQSGRYRGDDNASLSTKQQLQQPQQQQQQRRQATISQADAENAKFVGSANLEQDDGDAKSLLKLKKLKRLKNGLRPYLNPCSPFGRDANGASGKDANATPSPDEQGRFLFDLNVYNVYTNSPGYGGGGCGYGFGGGLGGFGGGFGGGLGGLAGGLLSDPLPVAPVRPLNPFTTWLSLFAPGILQNSLAVTARPLAAPYVPLAQGNDLQDDPAVDPNYAPVPPVRRPPPNRVYYDSAGAAPVTPAQLVGGVATTVNGIIQQLTGNVQPVYQSAYRTSRSYG